MHSNDGRIRCGGRWQSEHREFIALRCAWRREAHGLRLVCELECAQVQAVGEPVKEHRGERVL